MWDHDMYSDAVAAPVNIVRRAPGGGEGGGKLFVSNLHYNVTQSDLRVRANARRSASPRDSARRALDLPPQQPYS